MIKARESEFSQETQTIFHENGVDSSALNCFTVLKLPHLPPTATSIAEAAIKPLRKCSSCGSAKRRSPPPSYSSLHEPSSKRAAISTNPSSPNPSPPSSAEKNRGDTLFRSLSDFPCSPGDYQDLQNLSTPNSLNPLSTSPIPGNFKNPLAQSESQDSPVRASFPMVPKHLHRSPSYPFLSDYEPVENTTPPRPPALLPPQISYQASPNSKKLREIKEKVEDLMQWMGQVAHDEEDEDENTHQNNEHINYTSKEKVENQTHHDSVWVKQTDGGLILHFKCPCGEGYEVFLHGEKCYYRLT